MRAWPMLCIAWFFSVCPNKFPDSNLKNIKPAFSTALEIHHLPIYSNIIACRTIITLEYNLTRQGNLFKKRNTYARSPNHSCIGKAIIITYSECVSVALVTQHAKSMRRIILASVACLSRLFLSTFSLKTHNVRKQII